MNLVTHTEKAMFHELSHKLKKALFNKLSHKFKSSVP